MEADCNATVGHNLTVLRRRFMPYYLIPAPVKGLPDERLHDGIILADGDGGVLVIRPYAVCNFPDIYDLNRIMTQLWDMRSTALCSIDVGMADCFIGTGIAHYNSVSSRRYSRDRINKRPRPR